MGQRSPWISFTGQHDGTGLHSTIIFIDRPGNPRHPTRWFVRNDPFACISAAFSFAALILSTRCNALWCRFIAAASWARSGLRSALRSAARP